ADAGQILVEFIPILRHQSALHRARIIENEVEQRPLLGLASPQVFGAFARTARPKQPFKNEPRIVFWSQRRYRRTPGHIILIGARIAGIAGTGLAARVARKLDRWETSEMPDLARHELVDRDAGVNIRRALFHAYA